LTSLLVVLLAVLWGAVFLPAILRAREDASPIVSVGMFRRRMRALGGPSGAGRWVMMPQTPGDFDAGHRNLVRKRRRTFVSLLALVTATFTIGLIPHLHSLLKINAGLDLLFAGYVLYLIQSKQQRLGAAGAETEAETEEAGYLKAGQF
jgi:hypothetical protein